MTLSPNQFRQTSAPGYLDLQTGNNNVWNCRVSKATPSTDPDLIGGQTVVQVDVKSAVPTVRAATIGQVPFGLVKTSLKDTGFTDLANLEIARVGTVIYLTASAAIAAGADVQYDPTTHKIATKASTNGIIGQAVDKALADGDLIRVLVNPASGA